RLWGPQDVEYDSRDGKRYLVEVMSATRRGYPTVARNSTRRQKALGKTYVITPYIHDRDPESKDNRKGEQYTHSLPNPHKLNDNGAQPHSPPDPQNNPPQPAGDIPPTKVRTTRVVRVRTSLLQTPQPRPPPYAETWRRAIEAWGIV
ncbi:MAG: hypothetical protein ACK4SY_09760, partial [Pyrobaculum sp.]